MLTSILASMVAAMLGAQSTVAGQDVLELRGRIRDHVGGAEVTVGADGIVIKCEPLGREYDNVAPPPDICGAYPIGSRYGPPTTFKGRPMARKVKITITTHDVNVLR